MLRYFREGLKPSILAELEHRDLELESFNQMVKKAVDAEAKATLRPQAINREMDQHCPRGSRPAHNTAAKANTQAQSVKDSRSEESKARGPKSLSTLQRLNNTEFSNKARREKKKERRRRDREQGQRR